MITNRLMVENDRGVRVRRAAVLAFAALLLPAPLAMAARGAPATAPENLPPVAVSWEDAKQQDVFVVQGANYKCRVGTQPARLLALEVDGQNVLAPGGMEFSYVDGGGTEYRAVPPGLTPKWDVWQRRWVPAQNSRARMNVWNAGPYCWHARLVGIPLATRAYVEQLQAALQAPVRAEWKFDNGTEEWKAARNCQLTAADGVLKIKVAGDDPNFLSPVLNLAGPLCLSVRMRTSVMGGGELFWADDKSPNFTGAKRATFAVDADGAWHEYRVPLPVDGHLKRLRLDPPGSSGDVEIDTIKIQALPADNPAIPGPVGGELGFYAFGDQLRIEFKMVPAATTTAAAGTAQLATEAPFAAPATIGQRPVALLPAAGKSLAVLGGAGSQLSDGGRRWSAPLDPAAHNAVWIFRPGTATGRMAALFAEELDPLPAAAVTVTGGQWRGYDPVSGLYRLEPETNRAAFSFEQCFMNPARRLENNIRVRNDRRPRTIMVQSTTGMATMQAAVVADAHGFPLPVPVQTAKNFDGELEEPDDSSYGDAFFPITLAAGEERSFQLLHLFQNWGNHALKQVSFIRFFHGYWHMSLGAHETSCFTHNWMKMGNSGMLQIPDFRVLSGEMWPGQPQHHYAQWPGFLQYNQQVGLLHERTVFDSVSPNLARFTMYFHTTDGAASGHLQVMELPQRDEKRVFVRMRFDWQKPVVIEGDARMNFKWVNIFEKQTPKALMWTAPDGTMRNVPAGPLCGELLTAASPVVASDPAVASFGCIVLVRSFQARLGGNDYRQPAVSAQFGREDGNFWLTVPVEKLTLLPGDFLEAEVMLMPHGEPTVPELKPVRERTERFGAGIPRVRRVDTGRKIADFPATVEAADEVAAFTVEGGFDYMPLIVKGFRDWRVPLLWKDGVWQDQQDHGGDGYQVEPDGTDSYRFTFVYPIRKGQQQNFLVTRAECTTGIASLREVNGRLVIASAGRGEFTLKAPVLFAPGVNTITAGSPVSTFRGRGRAVHAAPVAVVPLGRGKATVEIDQAGTGLKITGGPARVTFLDLADGTPYEVLLDGKVTRQSAVNGTLQVKTGAPGCTLSLHPVRP